MSRILIINNDESSRMLLGTVLTEKGYEVILSGRSEDLLGQVSAAKPDLVLQDLVPDAQGDVLALAGAIRADPLLMDVPIIVISAARNMLHQHADALMDLRCQVLEQPFDLGDLLALIEAGLQEPIY
jgi:DNA-binding NtrC family response regulator